jgi:predicted MFS family arabinose efflux permease
MSWLPFFILDAMGRRPDLIFPMLALVIIYGANFALFLYIARHWKGDLL